MFISPLRKVLCFLVLVCLLVSAAVQVFASDEPEITESDVAEKPAAIPDESITVVEDDYEDGQDAITSDTESSILENLPASEAVESEGEGQAIMESFDSEESGPAFLPHVYTPVNPRQTDLSSDKNFKTDLYSGSFTYSYNIRVPPGTNGLQPLIRLYYNSQNSGQGLSFLGTGWMLGQSYMQRSANYTYNDSSDDDFTLVIEGSSYDLAYSESDGRYHTKVESYLRVENLSQGNNTYGHYWLVKLKDGTSYRFGFSEDSETELDSYGYAWRWNLDLVNDTYGNPIFYTYDEMEDTENASAYPSLVEYNADRKRKVEFLFESQEPESKLQQYNEGKKLEMPRRLTEILVKYDGALVRKYVLGYDVSDHFLAAYLKNITLFGNDNSSSLPPLRFEYKELDVGNWTNETTTWKPPKCFVHDNNEKDRGVRLADVNNDGLVDVLSGYETGGTSYFDAYINNGTGWAADTSWNPPTIFTNSTGDTGARLVDANGDGRVDILKGLKQSDCGSSTRSAWINNGTGWVLDDTWKPPEGVCFMSQSTPSAIDNGYRLLDANGDGLVDILRGYGSGGNCTYEAYINNGSGWLRNDDWKSPACFVEDGIRDWGVRPVDVNGDGLTDMVQGHDRPAASGGNIFAAWINNGTGWVADETWTPTQCFTIQYDTYSSFDSGLWFSDVNGDGLVDLLFGYASAFSDPYELVTKQAYINNGSGWVNDTFWKFADDAPKFGVFAGGGNKDPGFRLADINGDGLVDVVYGDETSGTCLSDTWINHGYDTSFRAYLLENITTESGGFMQLGYSPSTSFDNRGSDGVSDLGFNAWVVTSLTESNALEGASEYTVTTTYNYSGGTYDYQEREFRGFSQCEETKPGIYNGIHKFHQSDGLKGKEYETLISDASGNLYRKAEMVWNESLSGAYFIASLLSEGTWAYDGAEAGPEVTNVSYGYDDYGNIFAKYYLGDEDNTGDERFEYFDYAYASDIWIVDKPKNYYAFGPDNITKLKETWYSYDNLPYGQSPVRGSVTVKEDWLETGDNPSTNFSYDSYGNLISETDPNNHLTERVFGVSDTTYTFPDKVINAVGHVIAYTYDLGTGNALSITSPNAFLTSFTYDVFGRKQKDILPYDNETYPTRLYYYDFDGIAPEMVRISARETNGTNDTLDSWHYFDGFDRVVQVKNEYNGTYQVCHDTYYDSQAKVEGQSVPYLVNSTETFSDPDTSVAKMSYRYDPVGRLLNITNPDGSFKKMAYDHWVSSLYDENSHWKDFTVDAYGSVVSVVEHDSGDSYNTSYEYDSLGRLVRIADASGNTFNYSYDSLGRKTGMEDPDMGSWNYTYDGVGNLIEQVDNRGITVSMGYDPINRIILKNSSDDATGYAYDSPYNGTLATANSSNMTSSFTYDERLRKTRQEATISGVSFATNFFFDSLDRTTYRLLPDATAIALSYDEQGLLNSSEGVLDDVRYGPHQKPILRSYANNLSSIFDYDSSSQRLNRMRTGSIQDMRLGYDPVGNVLAIDDVSGKTNCTMAYDDIDRLIHAKRSNYSINPSKNTVFSFNFSYDPIGNIMSYSHDAENHSYEYSGSPVHAPARITIMDVPSAGSVFNLALESGNVASFTSDGSLVLKGECVSGGDCTSKDDAFNLYDSEGNVVAYFDTDGDLCIEAGDCSDNSLVCVAPAGSFSFQDSDGQTVVYIDQAGDLCLTGSLIENGDP